GLGCETVCRWRKALGVPRVNAGTARLLQESGAQLADFTRGREHTPADREGRRRTALEMNLGRHLVLGSRLTPAWTAEQLALLGTIPDEELAAKIGRTPNAIRLKRERMGIPNPAGRDVWKAEELALLGTLPDLEVSRRTGRTR